MVDKLISKDSSLVMKGGAILLMLIHHLFFNEARFSMWDDLHLTLLGHELGLVNQLGIFGKLCVSLFVFISGYGLSASYLNRELKVKTYLIRRFSKLYLNYWFVAIIFTLISVWCFGRTFEDAYGNSYIIKMILDFFGLLSMFCETGYNPTWWFYSCIILLYLLFPIINRYINESLLLFVAISIPLSFCVNKPIVCSISLYLLPFVVGVKVAKVSVTSLCCSPLCINLISLVVFAGMRNFCLNFSFIIDTLLCVNIAIVLYQSQLNRFLKKAFLFLGKHSMNIFLFHTFIYYFWFQNFIYSSRNPVVIVILLLVICLVISIFIEKAKRLIGFNRLLDKINKTYR